MIPAGWPSLAVTVLLAVAGGALAAVIGVPAAWLTGSMVAVTVVSVAGFDTRLPRLFFPALMIFIGITLGVGITPEIVAGAGSWPLSLIVLFVSIVAVQAGVQWFLVRVSGWDRSTAFFAAVPGAMSYVLVIAIEAGADLRKVAVAQSTRVFLLVAVLPALIMAIEAVQAPVFPPAVADPGGLTLLLAVGVAGGLLFHVLRVPAGLLCGSLAASGALHATGTVSGTLPEPAVIAVFVTLGVFVGSRFVGTALATLRSLAVASLGAFAVAIAVAAIFAALAAALTGVPLPDVLVAFAPGSSDAMTSLALALHMDLAFVSVHQLARFIAIAMATPFLARLARRKP